MYNFICFIFVICKFDECFVVGVLEKFCFFDEVDFIKFDDDCEWVLFLDFVLFFVSMIIDAAMSMLFKFLVLFLYGMYRVCDFFNMFVCVFLGYYGFVGVCMMFV